MKHTLYPYDFKGTGDLIVNNPYGKPDSITSYNVSEPVLEADHHKYRVSGVDPKTNKPFSVMRRLRHFYALRECLVYKYPALYIPPLPRKKAVNNLADETIQLRVFLLNRFIKQLSLCPYILNSDEFNIFLNPQQDLEKQLTFIQQNYVGGTIFNLAAVEPFFFLQGQFTDQEFNQAKIQIQEFVQRAKRMQSFLGKFIEIIGENEKKFD